jgi:membrane protease subunit HflC
MKNKYLIIAISIILLIIVLKNSLFIVNETEQVIITQFGQPVRSTISNAGLNIKIPFIQTIHYFEKRILSWDGESNQIPTLDKKFIWVDTFVRWKIHDPLLFYQSNRTITQGYSRLEDIVDGVTRDIITQNDLFEIVRSTNRTLEFSTEIEIDTYTEPLPDIMMGREKIAELIHETAYNSLYEYGIELVDVKIKRVNYIETVRKQVYDRMISERLQIAQRYRSSGQGRAAEIKGRLKRDLNEIESGAYKEAQQIRGNADSEAIAIHASAYNKDPDFFGFMRSLETYQKTFGEKSTLILSTDSDLYKYLKNFKR